MVVRGDAMRVILRLACALLVFAVLAVIGVLMIPAERVADAAARQFTQLTGRQLQIEGSVRPSFWPDLGVRTGPVTIANAPWSDAGPMLEADGLQIGVNLAGLFGGTVHITGLEADTPRLILERSRDGQENWIFGGSSGGTVTPDTPGVDAPFTFDRLVLKDATLTFLDHQADQSWTVEGVDLSATSPAWTGPLQLEASGRMNGQALDLTAEAAVFSDLVAGRVVPLTLALKAGEASVDFNGRAGMQPLQAEGQVQADLADLKAFAALACSSAPTLPDGLGAQAVAVSGAVTLAPDGGLFLRGTVIDLDGNRLTGAVDLAMGGPRPKLTAKLAGDTIALPATGAASGGDGAPTALGWSTEVIDVSGLGALDADIGLTLAGLTHGNVALGATRLRLVIDRARAVADIAEMKAYGGDITGKVVVNGRDGLSMRANLALAGLELQPLLGAFAGYDRLVGTGDLTLDVLGVGNSEADLMQSLSGAGALSVMRGEVRGLDVLGMLRTLDAGYVGDGQTTTFDAVTAGFAIEGGVLRNDDLTLTGPDLTATGAGQVGIGGRTLDYRLRPTALVEADGSGGVMVPLLITGTWENPKFRLDLESIARERMEEEAKALEERARAEAKRLEEEAKARLADELGVEAAPGEDLEDAARRRAQEVIDDEAQRLLENLLGNPEAPVAGE
jgi:AsmA protein